MYKISFQSFYFFSSLSFGWYMNFVEKRARIATEQFRRQNKTETRKISFESISFGIFSFFGASTAAKTTISGEGSSASVCVRDCRDVLQCFLSVSAPRWILYFAVARGWTEEKNAKNLSLFSCVAFFLLHVRCCVAAELFLHEKALARLRFCYKDCLRLNFERVILRIDIWLGSWRFRTNSSLLVQT